MIEAPPMLIFLLMRLCSAIYTVLLLSIFITVWHVFITLQKRYD